MTDEHSGDLTASNEENKMPRMSTIDPIADPRCRGIRIMWDRIDKALARIMSSFYCGDILAANPGLNTDAYAMLDRLAAQADIEVARDDRLDLAADMRHDALLDEAEALVQRLRGRLAGDS